MPRPNLMYALGVTITVAVAVQLAVGSNRAKLGLMLLTALLVLTSVTFATAALTSIVLACCKRC